MKQHIGEGFETGLYEMVHTFDFITRVLAVGLGVEIGASIVIGRDDVKGGGVSRGAFETHMFDEMSDAFFIGFVFMNRAHLNEDEKRRHGEGVSYRLMYIFEPVREGMGSYHL